ncbi:uncharacterized protein LOC131008065 [Salvia miltiorrhiza]|uniref:uncharacterized protein LOC131008065 n=1 Tax=Salvia miltiorrhiza TaxID=226208 RepID=UPI0025ACEF0E|nr:uncharacterized protein LOC131008065 [Salvia miltiorrhiza]
MAKAYDRVEWNFLDAMMRSIGFSSSFVDLIMRCVTSVSFSILVNGSPGETFIPSRGLRQGDPLSPFLFLFCAEALSGLLRKAETQNLIHGARLCRSAPSVSHLLFADDCVIFGRACAKEIRTVLDILGHYEGVSGQKVNLDKSAITFSGGITEDIKVELANQLGVRCETIHGSYLGIPSTVGRSKTEIFQMLVDRTRKKTKDWKRRFLSGAGKTTLIKSVLQSIPSYLMSCFALPDQICHRLNSVAARFFWGQKSEKRRIHWKSWRKLCGPKNKGGLGFRDLHLFNKAMLAKQVWRILLNDSSMLARSLKARYFPRSDILLANNAHNPSYAWRSLLVGRDLLIKGLAWRIGDGARIRIGIDAWIPIGDGNFRAATVPLEWNNTRVFELLLDTGHWDPAKLSLFLSNEELWKFSNHLQPNLTAADRPFWPSGKCNSYSVKSGYALAYNLREANEPSSSGGNDRLYNWIWNLEVIPKVRLFLWKCLVEALPTSRALLSRSISVDPSCPRCGEDIETVEHALRDCSWTRFFWSASPLRLPPTPNEEICTIPDWFEKIRESNEKDVHKVFANLIWTLWYARNLLVFQGKILSHQECFDMAKRTFWTKITCMPDSKQPNPHKVCRSRDSQLVVACDAAVLNGVGVGYGAVVTSASDSVECCGFGFLPGAFSVIEGEAAAMLEGMRVAVDYGWDDLIMETDCQDLFWMLTNRNEDRSYLGDVLTSIWEMANNLRSVEFSWTPREGNAKADRLAKFALLSRAEPSSSFSFPNVTVNSSLV